MELGQFFSNLTPINLFSFSALISAVFVLTPWTREWAVKLTAIFLVSTLAVIASNTFVYVGALFIIATLFTDGEYLLNLLAIMRGDKEWFGFQKFKLRHDSINASQREGRTPMEYKILNTLWTQQVNYYPEFSKLWGFAIGVVAPEYQNFRDAINRLIEEGLVFRNEQGMHFLTGSGIIFCAENYESFPKKDEQYYPDERIKDENLRIAVERAKKFQE